MFSRRAEESTEKAAEGFQRQKVQSFLAKSSSVQKCVEDLLSCT